MRMGTRTVAVCAVVCLHAATAAAQGKVMTLADVLARAREQAPQIVSARLALEEARGRLLGASVRFQANPEIDAALGNRNGPDSDSPTSSWASARASSRGARRSARIAGANAAIAQELRKHRRSHPDGAPPGCLGVLPRGARERADQAARMPRRSSPPAFTPPPIAGSRPATSPSWT